MLDGDRLGTQDVDTSEPAPEPVGERLREARLRAGMTLEQVSAATRIRVPVLRELEDDRLGPAGSAVYTRGHIRAIASAVGADPVPLVRAFDSRMGAAAPSAVVVPQTVPAPRPPTGRATPRLPGPVAPAPEPQPRWLTASLVGLVILVTLLAFSTFTGGSDDREPERAASRERSVADTVAPQAAARPAPAQAQATLTLEATGRSWLSVRNRGSVRLFEGQVEAGWTRTFADPVALTVRIGNAAAVRATCGPGAPQAPGAEGVALTLRCTPQGGARP